MQGVNVKITSLRTNSEIINVTQNVTNDVFATQFRSCSKYSFHISTAFKTKTDSAKKVARPKTDSFRNKKYANCRVNARKYRVDFQRTSTCI